MGKYLFLQNNQLKYFHNNELKILNKTLDSLTLSDFNLYGIDTCTIPDDSGTITVLSTDPTRLSYSVVPDNCDKAIKIVRADVKSVNSIILDMPYNTTARCMLDNGENLCSYKNGEWGKFECAEPYNSINRQCVMTHGMTCEELSRLEVNQFNEIWSPQTPYKIICVLVVDEFGLDNFHGVHIGLEKFTSKQTIPSNSYTENQTDQYITIQWLAHSQNNVTIYYQG